MRPIVDDILPRRPVYASAVIVLGSGRLLAWLIEFRVSQGIIIKAVLMLSSSKRSPILRQHSFIAIDQLLYACV